ncbi:(4Fe-4S)-binding protein [Chitinophaga nivalis]|uniref:(4Fe-4S)-binding protein n=1 Tax=Chitinophaga nivalis TaxID=2991709 RepID=A0ABT3ILD9_9BACT|nr:(4Fe-4S)-binding protein [Chitinophaga nivalis]MCW3465531.1 (4Fe-4S)-binding protein [Chitinophaga nivalis]MCW3484778.1 (4Fe-4S)-binding protein [Chitinophaga nivalis]
MKDITKKYTNEEVTVVWKPHVCVHSEICFHGLAAVFNPNQQPWINIQGADTERIIAQVKQCPSGALSYYLNSEADTATGQAPDITAESIVEPLPNGPLLVYGNIVVKDADGHEKHRSKVTAFCRCGASSNKPYCDGTHTKINFSDKS